MRDAPHPGDGPTTGARVRLVPVDAANRGAVAALTVAPEQSVGHRRGGCELLARRHHHRRPAPRARAREVRRHRRARPLGRPSDRRWVRPLVRARQPSGRGPLPRLGVRRDGRAGRRGARRAPVSVSLAGRQRPSPQHADVDNHRQCRQVCCQSASSSGGGVRCHQRSNDWISGTSRATGDASAVHAGAAADHRHCHRRRAG